ncbi:AraC family transcriptional regulator [Agrobacterium tumefaciens]|uniref:AraC family transcriptional regulator n=1 Tax=Agrobacterium tumefaciens TaxID=358 RepID=UPI001574C993|nr:AraC family transcriptional regulator [Agrobacterium tumefaciens]
MLSETPLVRLRVLTGFAEIVLARGADPLKLLRKAGVPTDTTDPETCFPLIAMCRLMALAAEELAMPDFGVQLSASQDLTALGAIALIALRSDTIEHAIHAGSRNMPYYSPALQSVLVRDGEISRLRIEHAIDVALPQKRHLAEFSLHRAVSILRQLTGLPGVDWTVHLTHPPGFEIGRCRGAFGCEVLFDQPEDQLCFPSWVLNLRLQTSHPALREVAERYVRSVIRSSPLDLKRQIEQLAGEQLGSGRCTLPIIASQLGMAERSLQRRLNEQQICFEQIIDELRQTRALELLAVKALPMTRVAESLGYSSQTSFTRSCQRWFGTSPRQLRNQIALGRMPSGQTRSTG